MIFSKKVTFAFRVKVKKGDLIALRRYLESVGFQVELEGEEIVLLNAPHWRKRRTVKFLKSLEKLLEVC